MKQLQISFSKITICFSIAMLMMLAAVDLNAQAKKGKKTGGGFGSTQWWIGGKAGLNFSQAVPHELFAVINSTKTPYIESEKAYGGYGKAGTEIGIVTTFDFWKFLSLSLQPSFSNFIFSYENKYLWEDPENSLNSLELNYDNENTLRYFELPLLVKVNFFRGRNKTNMRSGTNQRQTIKPYIQAGIYYGYLLDANKTIHISAIDKASGASEDIKMDDENAGVKELFIKSQAGFMGGAGVSYDFGSLRVSLEGNYKQGLHNIVNEKNRYASGALSAGAGDVFDNISLKNINVAIHFTFPMKFITSRDFVPINP